MLAASFACLSLSALYGLTGVLAVLNTPMNVHLISENMDLVLKWSPPEGTASDFVYTTEFKPSGNWGKYRDGCVNISTLECDLSKMMVFSEYGTYRGRVHAQWGEERSAWAESNEITLDRDTVIGSPNVSLLSYDATIEVSIKDPVFRISTLRNVYPSATYNITYWKDGQEEKTKTISGLRQNRVVLSELDSWTKHCVQVQVNIEMNRKPSLPSRIVCERTNKEKDAPWVAAVVTFLIMTLAVVLVVVSVVYRKRISHFLCPNDALPEHFKECVFGPPNSPVYLAIQNSQPPEEVYHQVSIVAGDMTLEERHSLDT